MLQKRIYLIILLYWSMLSIGNSSVVDNSQVTGVYEGGCQDKVGNAMFDLRAVLKGSKGGRVSGVVEFYPSPENKTNDSCGAFNVTGTLSYQLFKDNNLILQSESWEYSASVQDPTERRSPLEGAVEISGPFVTDKDEYYGMLNYPDGFEGCRGFSLKRISITYPKTEVLKNKKKCVNGVGVDSKANIVGLKLYMTPSEVEPLLERFKEKGYSVRKRANKTNYLDMQESYLESISISKEDEDKINIMFFRPPHDNTISSIARTREYIKDLDNAPFPEEVVNYFVKKYGSPRKWIKPTKSTFINSLEKNGVDPGKDDFQETGILWSDFRCYIGIITSFDSSVLAGRKVRQFTNRDWAYYRKNNNYPVFLYSNKECGTLFSYAYHTTLHKNDKRVSSYIMQLSDTTGIVKNNRKTEDLYKLRQVKEERIRLEKKAGQIKGSTFSDDI